MYRYIYVCVCEQIHICMYVCMFVCIYSHTHIYVCVCFNFQLCVWETKTFLGARWWLAWRNCHFCFECMSCVGPVVCSAYMWVLYVVFWSDCVCEFFLALFLAEFNPQLSSLANLWNKSELICITHSLR